MFGLFSNPRALTLKSATTNAMPINRLSPLGPLAPASAGAGRDIGMSGRLMHEQALLPNERTSQESRLALTVGKLAALIHGFTHHPGELTEDVLRATMKRMHEDVYAADFSQAKDSRSDCEELLDYALGIAKPRYGNPLYPFMPARYYVSSATESDPVIMYSLVIQCLFVFLAQAADRMREQGKLSLDDVEELKDEAVCMLQEMQLREGKLAKRGDFLANAMTCLRANLG
jgi:hypothetical protein